MKSIFIFFLLLITQTLWAQNTAIFKKGQLTFHLGLGLAPIQQKDARINFIYTDEGGEYNGMYLQDAIGDNFKLKNRYFGSVLCFGFSNFWSKNFRTFVNLKPHLNSLLSNEAKDHKTYGFNLDLGFDYAAQISSNMSISFGAALTRNLGRFGLTTGQPTNKNYLAIFYNYLDGDEFRFRIVDKSWGFSPRVGINYKLSDNFVLFVNSGYQINFNRNTKLDISALQRGRIEVGNSYRSSLFYDSETSLTVDGILIDENNINELPFKFSGLLLEAGITAKLND